VAFDVEGGRLRRVPVDSEDEGVSIAAKAAAGSTHVSTITVEDLEPVESNLCLFLWWRWGGYNIRGTCARRNRGIGFRYNLYNPSQTTCDSLNQNSVQFTFLCEKSLCIALDGGRERCTGNDMNWEGET
jgi:hypothetical protein